MFYFGPGMGPYHSTPRQTGFGSQVNLNQAPMRQDPFVQQSRVVQPQSYQQVRQQFVYRPQTMPSWNNPMPRFAPLFDFHQPAYSSRSVPPTSARGIVPGSQSSGQIPQLFTSTSARQLQANTSQAAMQSIHQPTPTQRPSVLHAPQRVMTLAPDTFIDIRSDSENSINLEDSSVDNGGLSPIMGSRLIGNNTDLSEITLSTPLRPQLLSAKKPRGVLGEINMNIDSARKGRPVGKEASPQQYTVRPRSYVKPRSPFISGAFSPVIAPQSRVPAPIITRRQNRVSDQVAMFESKIKQQAMPDDKVRRPRQSI